MVLVDVGVRYEYWVVWGWFWVFWVWDRVLTVGSVIGGGWWPNLIRVLVIEFFKIISVDDYVIELLYVW